MPDITIAGATFRNVPSIDIPKDGGGTASFVYEDGSKSITENGTHDVSGFAEAIVNVSGGGGDPTYVHGEFTTQSTSGVQTITIPHQGSTTAYLVKVFINVKGGLYNPNTDWYSLVSRYSVGIWSAVKINTDTPIYNTAGDNDNSSINITYKSSSSSATAYAYAGAINNLFYSTQDPTNTSMNCVKMYNRRQLKIYVKGTSGYGFVPNTTYEYAAVYSS